MVPALPPMPARPLPPAFPAALALAALLVLPASGNGQLLRTLFTVGGPADTIAFGSVVRVEVEGPGKDARIRVVDDAGRAHLFDPRGIRMRVDSIGSAARERAVTGGEAAAGRGGGRRSGEDPTGPEQAREPARIVGDSTVVRVGGREVALPGSAGGEPFRVRRVLGDGTGRIWLRVCRVEGCGDPERWLVLDPPATPPDAPSFTGLVLPAVFRLEAVRGSRLYGVQGRPGRQSLHVLTMYEDPGGG